MNRSAKKFEQPDEFEEMRAEYDFKGGERGRHAHLFGEVSEDENLVAAFWKEKGFDPQRFEKAETRFAKSPDFRLYKDSRLVAFCEVKTFQHDAWLDKKLAEAGPGELVGGLRPDPIFNRISNVVHTAAKQLEAVNPNHELLNFLVLVNRDKSAKAIDLDSVLTGYLDPLHGVFERTHTQFSEGRIREEKRKIDLYSWMTPTSDGRLACKRLFFGSNKTSDQVCKLIGVNPNEIKVIA